MRLPRGVIEELMVEPGRHAGLAHRSTADLEAGWPSADGAEGRRDQADRDLEGFKAELESAQELLYGAGRWALLVIFQALDAAGKDGTIKHVMSGVNPQGCSVASFRQPSPTELAHDFLWRCSLALPERGRIGIFNRSYYEEVLVVRVHPELVAAQHLPPGTGAGGRLWRDRYEDINAFERHLTREGTKIVKFFLHVSKEEQRRRLLARLDDPAKQWKFSPGDVAERERFDDYQKAYEDALTATSTAWAPWYVVPADHKHQLRALVAGVIVHAIDQLDLSLPTLDQPRLEALRASRKALEGQKG